MVQALNPAQQGGRPASVGRASARSPASIRQNEEFRHVLRASTDRHCPPGLAPASAPAAVGSSPAPRAENNGDSGPRQTQDPESGSGMGCFAGDPAGWLALLNPPPAGEAVRAGEPQLTSSHGPAVDLSGLVERWVRRVGLGGDPRRGVARIDIGQGRFAGAELLIVAEAGHVSVELSLPAAVGAELELSGRLRARLERRGYAVDVMVR